MNNFVIRRLSKFEWQLVFHRGIYIHEVSLHISCPSIHIRYYCGPEISPLYIWQFGNSLEVVPCKRATRRASAFKRLPFGRRTILHPRIESPPLQLTCLLIPIYIYSCVHTRLYKAAPYTRAASEINVEWSNKKLVFLLLSSCASSYLIILSRRAA